MSIQHLAWASEQSCIRPGAKLLAIFIASNHGLESVWTFRLEDAAAWCCCDSVEVIEDLLHDLEWGAGLKVVRNWTADKYDMTVTVRVPVAKNGGHLL